MKLDEIDILAMFSAWRKLHTGTKQRPMRIILHPNDPLLAYYREHPPDWCVVEIMEKVPAP